MTNVPSPPTPTTSTFLGVYDARAQGLIPLTAGAIWWSQSAGFAYFGAAAAGAALGAKCLKHILRQPRPVRQVDQIGVASLRVAETTFG